jgi:dihydroxy-acid dehydratase
MGTKSNNRSRIAIDGLDRTPHRAFLRATGLDDDDLGKPMVGVVSTHGENTPCSMSLGPQADAARLAWRPAARCRCRDDHLRLRRRVDEPQGHAPLASYRARSSPIPSRRSCAAYDALVGFAGCDKMLPGIMMAMVRLNCPSCSSMAAPCCPAAGADAT